MSANLVQESIALSRASGCAYQLLLVIAHQSRDRTVWTHSDEMARASRLPRATMYRARQELLELGELRVVEQGGGRGKLTIYELVDLKQLYRPTVGRLRSEEPSHNGRVSAPETVSKPSQNRPTLARARVRDRRSLTPPKAPPLGGATAFDFRVASGSHRERDRQRQRDELGAWMSARYPAADPSAALRAGLQALDAGVRDAEQLDAFIKQWWPQLLGPLSTQHREEMAV